MILDSGLHNNLLVHKKLLDSAISNSILALKKNMLYQALTFLLVPLNFHPSVCQVIPSSDLSVPQSPLK